MKTITDSEIFYLAREITKNELGYYHDIEETKWVGKDGRNYVEPTIKLVKV